MNSRLYNCLKVFDTILKTAREHQIKRILLNGDILEDSGWIEVETYNALYRKLEMLYDAGLEIVINLGNHDVYAELDGKLCHSLTPFRKIARVIEKPALVWGCVWVVPWMSSPERFKETIKSLQASKEYCLVAHCGVQGAKTGPKGYLVRNPIKLRDLRYREFRLVLLSDYHHSQFLAKGVLYLGSPLQHSFGEIHHPGIWIVSDKGLKKVHTGLPQFHRIKVSSVEQLKEKTKEHENDYYSVQISTGSSSRQAYIEAAAKSLGIRFKLEARREDESGEISTSSLAFNPLRAIQRYAKRKNCRTQTRKLGLRLYEGDV
jgi:DNA repair exonuclease SbcCD nuclease subunit